MMSLIMGQRRPDALARAVDLGVAMQFSNIARDVEEDEKLGRVYVPEEWIIEGKVQAAGRLVTEAEIFYTRAASGIGLLPRSCRASINAARLLYREIGRVAAAQHHKGRAIVSLPRKLSLVAKAIFQTPWLPKHNVAPCLPEAQFLLDAVAQMPSPISALKNFDEQMGWVMKMFMAVEARKS